MNREYHTLESAALGRVMEFLVFGHGGDPVLVYPTTQGSFYQYEDFGMVGALAPRLEDGAIQLFCVDSVDAESWYNQGVPPPDRVRRHVAYDRHIVEEMLPYVRSRNGRPLTVTGTSFGAYHAVNFAMRHPALVRRLVALSGKYDVRVFMDGYYDDNVYFNNPIEFLPNLKDEAYLAPMRAMDIVLLTGEHDQARESTEQLSRILSERGVPNRYMLWHGYPHDWPLWREAITHYL